MPSPSWNASRGGGGGVGWGVKTHEEGRKETLAIELLFFFKVHCCCCLGDMRVCRKTVNLSFTVNLFAGVRFLRE